MPECKFFFYIILLNISWALASSPDPDQQYIEAKTHYQYDNREQALVRLEKNIKTNPQHLKSLELLYDIYIDDKKYNSAKKVLVKIISLKHHSKIIEMKSAIAMRHYLRHRRKGEHPTDEILNRYYQLGLIHLFILDRKLKEGKKRKIYENIKEATKYFSYCKQFNFRINFIKIATSKLKFALEKNLDNSMPEKKVKSIPSPPEQIKKKTFVPSFTQMEKKIDSTKKAVLVNYLLWNEKLISYGDEIGTTDNRGDFIVNISGVCPGAGLEKNIARISLKIESCIFIGSAKIDSLNNPVIAGNQTVDVLGGIITPGVNWNSQSSHLAIGIELPFTYRTIDFSPSTSIDIPNKSTNSLGANILVRIKWWNLFTTFKYGVNPVLSNGITTFQVAYRF